MRQHFTRIRFGLLLFIAVTCALAPALYGLTLAAGIALGQPASVPQIRFAEFSIKPTTLKLGDSFVIRASAETHSVPLGSFLLRTADEVRREDKIPGFSLYARGKYYVGEEGTYYLLDNGKLDGDPRDRVFTLEITTEGWREGEYNFAFFASRRPAKGPFVAARRDFAVAVRDGKVFIEDLGPSEMNGSRLIEAFQCKPPTAEPGKPVEVSIGFRPRVFQGIRITNPFYIDPADVLPGFFYDVAQKKSFHGSNSDSLVRDNGECDLDPARNRVAVELAAEQWPCGVHHFLLEVVGLSGTVIDDRSFAVKVPDPRDSLDVHVGDSYLFSEGTHFGRFIKLRDGTILCADRLSQDGGRSWRSGTGGFGAGGHQLADGSVLGMAYKCGPEDADTGWYPLDRYLSTNGGQSFEKGRARVFVPQAKPAMGHGPYDGPIFMRSIVERNDGSLAALMAGWFESDTELCPYGRGRPYSRTYICESDDRGLTWRYVGTIGYAHLGSEGYNEGSMRRLPNGELLAVMRTGNERDFKCQDNPIMWSVSRDQGRTWTEPERTGVEGAYPSLAVLSDGLVTMSYGRPGAMLVFSADNGRTWTDHTLVDATPYSGYTDVVELAPGELLVGFGAKDFLDPTTRTRTSQLRLVRICYEIR
jgi:hypothetical protein